MENKYKVLSPFLGSSKTLDFGKIIGEKDFVPGDLKKRLDGKYVELIEEKKKQEKKKSSLGK